ncbi:MAG: hypothetical protein IVW54_14220 [Candidatus Binataceae bacterium]|nr:hypothetical protein [Candidatus Binataceae bacterium]
MLLSGCTWQSPRAVVQNYLAAIKQHRYEQCYAMLTDSDRQAYTLQQFLTAIPLTPSVTQTWFRPVLEDTSYDIGEPRGQGLHLIVPVKVITPDLPRFERTIDAIVGPDVDPAPVARRALANGEYPDLGYDDQVVLIKEHHRWRVKADFPALEDAARLRRSALQYYYRAQYGQAVQEYQQAIAALAKADSSGGLGKSFLYRREMKEIQEIAAGHGAPNPARMKVADVGMRVSTAQHPALFGKITNPWKVPIDNVRMKVTFFQGSGAARRAIFAEEHVAIATPIEFSDFTIKAIPLAPGETRNFGFELKAPAATEQDADPFVAVDQVAATPTELIPAKGSELHTRAPEASPAPRSGTGEKSD